MHHQSYLKGVLAAAFMTALAWQTAPAQDSNNAPRGDAALRAEESQGIPPRTGPNDYQARAQVGAVTIAADYDQHGVPTPEATFSTEDYIVVEVGFFGPPGTHLAFNYQDFTLRVNGKKNPRPAQPFAEVFRSLKDPSWIPPEPEQKSKTTIGGGSGGNNGDPPPAPPKMPFELRRTMEQRVKKASLPVGDRPLPQDGLLYFEYGGKPSGIRSIELIYNGPAGKAAIPLQP